jgi:ribulose-5-phosphate 4-epimerase/fuculose-1-phosphate aldolase
MGGIFLDARKELARFARIAEEKGLVNTVEGNLSLLDRETGLVSITPSRTMKLLLRKDQVCVLDPAGKQVGGTLPPSSEYRLHLAAYGARPDCAACLHSHVPFLSAFSMREKALEIPENAGFLANFKEIPCLRFGMPGTDEIHRGLSEALRDHGVVLLGRHGALSVGRDLPAALGLMEAAEALAKTFFISKAVGGAKKFEDETYRTLLAMPGFR